MDREQKKPVANNSAEGRARKKKRKAEIFEMLTGGVPQADIIRQCSGKYGLHTRTVEKYLSEVRRQIPNMHSWGERKMMLNEGIAKAETLYAKALVKKDYRTAHAVLRSIWELQGLTLPQQLAAAKMCDLSSPKEMTLEVYNAAIALYNQPQWTREMWDRYQRDEDPYGGES